MEILVRKKVTILDDEIDWIPGYEGLYKATKSGYIVSVQYNKPRALTPEERPSGRLVVALTNSEGYKKKRGVGNLVLLTFVRPKGEGEMCHYQDGDKANNRLSNLE